MTTKTILSTPKEFTKKDYITILENIFSNVDVHLGDKWNDRNNDDPGVGWAEINAYVYFCLNLVINHVHNESLLPTAYQRENIKDMLALIGYRLRERVAATGTVKFYITIPLTVDIFIPKHTSLSSSAGIEFVTTESALLSAGSTEVEVSVAQGTVLQETFIADGDPRQIFDLTSTISAEGTWEVSVDGDDYIYEDTDSFVGKGTDEKYFIVQNYKSDFLLIKFGDNVEGAMPEKFSEIVVTYLETDGEYGNVAANSVTTINSSLTYDDIYCTNVEAITGGAEKENHLVAKWRAPKVVQAEKGLITGDDISTYLEALNSIGRAFVKDFNSSDSIQEYNNINIYAIANMQEPPTTLTQIFYNTINEVVEDKCSGMNLYTVKSVTWKPLDIIVTASVYKKYISSYTSIYNAILNLLSTSYYNGWFDYLGYDIYTGEFYQSLGKKITYNDFVDYMYKNETISNKVDSLSLSINTENITSDFEIEEDEMVYVNSITILFEEK